MEMQGWNSVKERAARNEQCLDDFRTDEEN